MEQTIYLDHAATSFPKAPGVGDAMKAYMEHVGVNINRSTYGKSTEAGRAVLDTRERLCRLFGFTDPAHVVFTPGQTASLNMALKGFLKPGDHVLVSSFEHNAVMRPLTQLLSLGVTFDRVPVGPDGPFDLAAFSGMFRENTRLCAVTHASNVSGAVLPVEEIGKICSRRGVPLLVDAAQTAGHYPVSFSGMHAAALALPGHKGLLGPAGVGALLLSPAFARALTPLIAGGTGSMSDSEELPPWMPDRLESGTLNLPGIYGLRAALAFLEETGTDALQKQEAALKERFLSGLAGMPNLRIVGPDAKQPRVGVVSIEFLAMDNADAAFRLEQEGRVLTRCGLHCAPAAHKALGTFPQGTVRFSVGYGNTEEEIDAAVCGIRRLAATR